jgi:hypothetical protein
MYFICMSSFSSLFFSAWPYKILKITSQVCFNGNFFALFRNSCIHEVILTHLEQILNCFHLFVTCVGIKINSNIMSFSCNLSKINIVNVFVSSKQQILIWQILDVRLSIFDLPCLSNM